MRCAGKSTLSPPASQLLLHVHPVIIGLNLESVCRTLSLAKDRPWIAVDARLRSVDFVRFPRTWVYSLSCAVALPDRFFFLR